jgi:hypothetical protein
MASINFHQPEFVSVESLSQSPSAASRITIVAPTSQLDQSLPKPRAGRSRRSCGHSDGI